MLKLTQNIAADRLQLVQMHVLKEDVSNSRESERILPFLLWGENGVKSMEGRGL